MKYIVAGGTMLNDMVYADGTRASGYIGGSVYALNGIKPYDDEVLYTSKVGPDWNELIGSFFSDNNLTTEGFYEQFPHTMYSDVVYEASGEWNEHSLYPEMDFAAWREGSMFTVDELIRFFDKDTKGFYIEGAKGATPKLVSRIHEVSPNCKVMIELNTRWCMNHELHENAWEQIRCADIYSLNLPESKVLFGAGSEEESVKKIIEIGVPCFFRVGTDGAYMIEGGKAWKAPLVDFGKSVDPTGCGNCSTAASLYGFAEGLHPLMTCIKANIASGINAAQLGPFLKFTDELREYANETAEKIYNELINMNAEDQKPYKLPGLYEAE